MCAQEPVRPEERQLQGTSLPSKSYYPRAIKAVNTVVIIGATILEKEKKKEKKTGLMTSLLKLGNQHQPQPGCNPIKTLQ